MVEFSLADYLFSFGVLLLLGWIYLNVWVYFKSKMSLKYTWKNNIISRLKWEWLWGVLVGIVVWMLFVFAFSLFKGKNLFVEKSSILLLFCLIFWTLFVNFGGEFLHLMRQSKNLENRIRLENKEQIKIQKEILQDLISPHFLFNSLNTIISIIPENKENSIRFVNELSELYNFMLVNSQKETLLISEDLILAKKYVYLLQTRLESSLNVEFKIENKYLSCLIPPFTLQNLIENAVKHNSVTKKLILNIQIYIQDNFLVVQNNLNPKINSSENATNLGLNYIKTLLEPLSEQSIIVEKTEFDFLVKIPLIYQLN